MVITLKMIIHPVQEASQRVNRIAPPSALLIRPMHLASACLLRLTTSWCCIFDNFSSLSTEPLTVLLLTLYRPKCLYISWALCCVPLDLWAASQSASTVILLLLYSLLFRLAERGERQCSGVSVNITLAWIATLNSIHCWTLLYRRRLRNVFAVVKTICVCLVMLA